MYYRTNADIVSTFNKGYIYAKKGELVRGISIRDEVAIVEGKNGRFPVHITKLKR